MSGQGLELRGRAWPPVIFAVMSHSEDPGGLTLDTSPAAWYDLWHTHVDWDGRGNTDPEYRAASIATLFRILESPVAQSRDLHCPSNVWLLYVPGTAEDDSIYVHTPNPNGTPFPYAFAGVSWGVKAPDALGPRLKPDFEVGFSSYREPIYWVRMRRAT